MESGKQQLQYLEQFYQSNENQILVVYGQQFTSIRELLFSFAEGKDVVYYCARNCSSQEQINQMASDFDNSQEALHPGCSYEEVWSYIMRRPAPKKVILIDDFHVIAKGNPELIQEMIQQVENPYRNTKVLLVLLSNSIQFVENSLVDKLGIYARKITAIWKIKPATFREYNEYVRKREGLVTSQTKLAVLDSYMLLGGFEQLWELYDSSRSFKDNVISLFLVKMAPVTRALEALLGEEIREKAVYYTILLSLAQNRNKLQEMHHHTGYSRAKISVYLKHLMQQELVGKQYSFLTPREEEAKVGIYWITNPLVCFYFRYIQSYYSAYRIMDPSQYYDLYIEPIWHEFRAIYAGAMLQECMQHQNTTNSLAYSYKRMGTFVGKLGTIDVVAEDDSGNVLLAAAKWTENPYTLSDYEWLIFCAEKAGLKPKEVVLYAVAGYEDSLVNTVEGDIVRSFHSIEELCGEL